MPRGESGRQLDGRGGAPGWASAPTTPTSLPTVGPAPNSGAACSRRRREPGPKGSSGLRAEGVAWPRRLETACSSFLHRGHRPSGAPRPPAWRARYHRPLSLSFPLRRCVSGPCYHSQTRAQPHATGTRTPGGRREREEASKSERTSGPQTGAEVNTGGAGRGRHTVARGGRRGELVRGRGRRAEPSGQVSPAQPPPLTLAATASMLAGTTHSKVLAFFSRE